MLKLKVAFQGGGARLVTLIAAAHALREMQDAGEVKVELVSGASAGALAACMFSQAKSFTDQIKIIRECGSDILRDLRSIPKTRFFQFLNVSLGRPLLKERALRNLIINLFYGGDAKASVTLSALPIPTFITLSDLDARRKVISGPRDEAELVEILSDSCALPFVFRTHKTKSRRVDGGITSNLPADLILNTAPSDVIPLAFRFADTKAAAPPKDFGEYALSVITTAIDASVEMSAKSVVDNGGCVCELPNHFETLEFTEALVQGLHAERYDTAKDAFKARIRKALAPYGNRASKPPSVLGSARPEQALFDAHNAQMRSFPFTITETTTAVFCHSLHNSDSPLHSPADHIYQTYTATSNGPIFFLRIAVPSGSDLYRDAEFCVVKDASGAELESFDFPVIVDDPFGRFGKVRYILVYLEKPAQVSQMPLRVTYRTMIGSSMARIKAGGDWIKTRTSEFGNLSTESQIVLLPKTYSKLHVEDLVAASHKLAKERGEKALLGTSNNWRAGRAMTAQEHAAVFASSDLPGRFGWHVVGWVATNVPADHFSGALFTVK